MKFKPAQPPLQQNLKKKSVKDDSEIQIARISSSATIQVTRAQVIGTIIVSLLTLSGVAIANWHKMSSSDSTPRVNKLLLDNEVKRVHDFIGTNLQDVQAAQPASFTALPELEKEKMTRALDSYKVTNQEATKEFINETEALNKAVEADNLEAVEAAKRRLIYIAMKDASNLQRTIEDVNRILHPSDIEPNKEVNKSAEEPSIEKLLNRNPVIELSSLLPIKRETSQPLAVTNLRLELGSTPSNQYLLYTKNGTRNSGVTWSNESPTGGIVGVGSTDTYGSPVSIMRNSVPIQSSSGGIVGVGSTDTYGSPVSTMRNSVPIDGSLITQSSSGGFEILRSNESPTSGVVGVGSTDTYGSTVFNTRNSTPLYGSFIIRSSSNGFEISRSNESPATGINTLSTDSGIFLFDKPNSVEANGMKTFAPDSRILTVNKRDLLPASESITVTREDKQHGGKAGSN